MKKCFNGRNDFIFVRTDQKIHARINTFRPFRDIAHHEYGFPKCRRFFLQTARIGEHKRCAFQSMNKIRIGQGIKQMHSAYRPKPIMRRRFDIRVRMNRINKINIRMRFCQMGNGIANV